MTSRLLSNMFIFIPSTLLLVDSISGFILLNNISTISVSIFYKFIFISICLVIVFSRGNRSARLHVSLLMLNIIIVGLGFVFLERESYAIYYIIEIFKLFSTFFIFYGIISIPSRFYPKLNNFYKFTIIVLLFNMLLSFLGFGFKSYGDYGFKGFIYGGNALSGIVVIIATYYLLISKSNVTMFIKLVFLLFISYLLGTKSAILGVFLSYVIIVASNFRLKDSSIIIFILFLFFIMAPFVIDSFVNTAMFERLNYFYNNGGIEVLIFSGRLEFLFSLWDEFSDRGLTSYFFGLDPLIRESYPQSISEMDVTDIILTFGFPTLFFYIISMVYVISNIFCFSKNILRKVAVITSIVLICIGTVAGHVLFNGVITPYWGVVLSLPILYEKFISENNENSNINI